MGWCREGLLLEAFARGQTQGSRQGPDAHVPVLVRWRRRSGIDFAGPTAPEHLPHSCRCSNVHD
jgi:hypothetical protein